MRKAAFAAAEAQHQLVFLHFGAPWCGYCRRLEAWMARPEIAALLAKEFVTVEIDTDRMRDGKQVYEAELQRAGVADDGIPWFLFCRPDGSIVATSNKAGSGNIGFPIEADEIEAFAGMLRKARQQLSDAEVATLVASLKAVAKAGADARGSGH